MSLWGGVLVLGLGLTAAGARAPKPPPAAPATPAPAPAPAPASAPAQEPTPVVTNTTPPTFTWDVPRVLETVDVPDIIRADGIPVKLRSVKSAEKPQVILQHLVNTFEAAGFFIPPDSQRTQRLKEPQLTALDVERLISYTFFLQANPDGTTSVLLGEANLGQARTEQTSFAPLYAGAREVMQSDMEGARALSYTVEADPAKVAAFYVEELRAAGFTETEEGLWRRGSEEFQVGVRPARPGEVVVVVLRRLRPEELRQPPEVEPEPLKPKSDSKPEPKPAP